MHFSTKHSSEGESATNHSSEGESARLTTRRMTPGRTCQVQCLQFYYYYSGNETDQLNIWIREFDSEEDTEGTRRLMGQITGNVQKLTKPPNSPPLLLKSDSDSTGFWDYLICASQQGLWIFRNFFRIIGKCWTLSLWENYYILSILQSSIRLKI